jgi:glucan 1,3-beta-glucosidase
MHRIPTTYAAWIQVPGSALYHGNQQSWLKLVTDYAIKTHGMHIIIGLHSLPGGVNMLGKYCSIPLLLSSTNLDYSYQAVDKILEFIKASGNLTAWTIAPLNEASDNIQGFGTDAGLTAEGAAWINTYMHGVLDRIAAVDKRIPLMIQVSFKSPAFWAPYFDSGANIVFDDHIYFYISSGVYAEYASFTACGAAKAISEEQNKFPVFVGEWTAAVSPSDCHIHNRY